MLSRQKYQVKFCLIIYEKTPAPIAREFLAQRPNFVLQNKLLSISFSFNQISSRKVPFIFAISFATLLVSSSTVNLSPVILCSAAVCVCA